MDKLKDIIRDNRISTCPEYYSGRGATRSDLNAEILQGIYQGILKEFGKDAAKNFVKMVADIKVLSATTFLEELYQLSYCDWKYIEKKRHADGVVVGKNEDGEYDELNGMVGVITAMFHDGRDDTESIRGHFVRSHGIKPKGGTRHIDSIGNYYYED